MTDSRDIVISGKDIPQSAASNDPSLVTSATVTSVTGAGTTVADMWIRNSPLNYYLTNKDTRFENLVFAITAGYSASPEFWRTDQEFATRACTLARAIAYEMAKYEAT